MDSEVSMYRMQCVSPNDTESGMERLARIDVHRLAFQRITFWGHRHGKFAR